MNKEGAHLDTAPSRARRELVRPLLDLLRVQRQRLLLGLVLVTTFLLGAAVSMARERLYLPYKASISKGEIKPIHRRSDPSALLRLHSNADIHMKRRELIKLVWGDENLSASLPVVEAYIADDRYSDLEHLHRIERLRIQMEYGIDSTAYHFRPKQRTRGVVLYHQGHRGDFILGKKFFSELLRAGYDVVALSMPLLGANSTPEVDLPGVGVIQLVSHDQFALLELSAGTPIKFFLEPVLQSVNYVQAEGLGPVFMMGISGGGWTTTVYAALDPRVVRSYPFAGSLPAHLRSSPGDLEQSFVPFYRAANYLELYVMAAFEKGRRQLQVLNMYDPCCFSGKKGELYEGAVQRKLAQLNGGTFEVFIDDSHYGHEISSLGFSLMLKDLSR